MEIKPFKTETHQNIAASQVPTGRVTYTRQTERRIDKHGISFSAH